MLVNYLNLLALLSFTHLSVSRGREHLVDYEHSEIIYLVIRDRFLSPAPPLNHLYLLQKLILFSQLHIASIKTEFGRSRVDVVELKKFAKLYGKDVNYFLNNYYG